jgi:hypothetical protein
MVSFFNDLDDGNTSFTLLDGRDNASCILSCSVASYFEWILLYLGIVYALATVTAHVYLLLRWKEEKSACLYKLCCESRKVWTGKGQEKC